MRDFHAKLRSSAQKKKWKDTPTERSWGMVQFMECGIGAAASNSSLVLTACHHTREKCTVSVNQSILFESTRGTYLNQQHRAIQKHPTAT